MIDTSLNSINNMNLLKVIVLLLLCLFVVFLWYSQTKPNQTKAISLVQMRQVLTEKASDAMCGSEFKGGLRSGIVAGTIRILPGQTPFHMDFAQYFT